MNCYEFVEEIFDKKSYLSSSFGGKFPNMGKKHNLKTFILYSMKYYNYSRLVYYLLLKQSIAMLCYTHDEGIRGNNF